MKNGLIFLRRLFCCKLPVAFRARQMWWKNIAQSWYTTLSSSSRSRKIIFLILLLLGLIYYLAPTIFRLGQPVIRGDTAEGCVEERVASFHKSFSSYDAIVNHKPLLEGEKSYPTYVGNGYVAAAFDSSNGLFVRLNRALSLPVPYYPVIGFSVDGLPENREANVLDIRSGLAYRIQSFKLPGGYLSKGGCLMVGSQMYAHRSRPSVLVQDIRIHNPGKSKWTVDADQVGASGWKTQEEKVYKTNGYGGTEVSYKISAGLVKIQDSDSYVAVAVGNQVVDKSISVAVGSKVRLHVVTVTHYSQPLTNEEAIKSKSVENLIEKVQTEISEVLRIESKQLRQAHTKAWGKLWQTGFGLSSSKAEGALNGDRINSTLYYVLSNVPAPLYNPNTPLREKQEIYNTLHYPDRCYGGHSTLQASTLWVDLTDEDEIARLVTTWMITLEKQGCAVMVKAGAEGVLQAMVLSFGALKFSNDHLEFAMEPKDLHRDFYFHRLNYGNNTHVNISVIVGENNKAKLFVALDRNDRPYYACDAGCIDPPFQLSREWKEFPVKLTAPLTSILYITADKMHMEELKHAIHVKEIVEAPPHEHHVIALHKHGHHFGGLPTLFWVSIAFLVIIFHLFLVKLIYNEYCTGQERFTNTRSRYNV